MTTSKREDLLETALSLFTRNGYHATGIDRILAESGVAKMTLYNHFESKDELILAALRLRDERFREGFTKEVERRGRTQRDRLLAVFDILEDWYQEDDFQGCAFLKAAGEFSAVSHPIHAAAVEHTRHLEGYLAGLARDAGAAEPERLGRQLLLLVFGATTFAQVTRSADAARTARAAAEALLALDAPALDAPARAPRGTGAPRRRKGKGGLRGRAR